jgi:hypothetical protein
MGSRQLGHTGGRIAGASAWWILATAHHPLTAVHSEEAKKDFGHHKCLTLLFLGKKVFEYMIGHKRVGRDLSGTLSLPRSYPANVTNPTASSWPIPFKSFVL